MRRAAAAALALLVAGCADNAILEVDLELPATSASTPRYAFVQSLSASTIDFGGAWAGADATEGFLLTSAPSTQHVSFVTDGDAIGRPLGIRVRFCTDRVCGALADVDAPEARYVVDRAFYRGQRTRLTLSPVPETAPTTTEIGKCEVRGCSNGAAATYCFADGRHFCE